jgi:GNAT superfamily N-acetyltransferase
MEHPPLWINEQREQTVRLRDGRRVILRLIRPEDREHIQRGLQKLSPGSRYRRFLSATTTLSDAALRYLTEVDQWDHVALVALARFPDHDEGLGVGRFIRVADAPDVAEAAVTVTDAVQGQGLGRMLLAALTVAAVERQVTRFRGEVLTSNTPILDLLRELDPGLTIIQEGATTRIEAVLPVIPTPIDWEALKLAPANRLLKLAARGIEFKALPSSKMEPSKPEPSK